MSKSRDIADSAATINYIDTVTSNVQTQIDNIDPLPSQTGQSGKFLTTDGSAASWDAVDVSSEITGTLPVANGGTGATTLTANNVLLGNGTSAPLAVAPSTSGNVLTSNGTTWQSTAPAGAVTPLNLTLISGQDFSSTSATEISFTGLDNSYDYYLLFTNALELGTQVNPDLHLSSNNGSTYAYDGADVNYRALMERESTPWEGQADSDNNRIWTNSNQVTAYTYLYGIGNSEIVKFTTWYHTFDDSSNFGWQLGRGNNSTNNINAIRYKFNATATSGAVYLYGVTI